MPNIMVIGFDHIRGKMIGSSILRAIRRKHPKIAKDAVITNVCDNGATVFDSEGKSCPYIRICSSDPNHFYVILAVIKWAPELKGMKFEIECLQLHSFQEVVCCG